MSKQSAVLLVDSDATVRAAFTDSLADRGIEVHCAADSDGALRTLADKTIGLVIADWQLESQSGIDLLARIRSSHPRIPAVLMTAEDSAARAVRGMRNGAVDVLAKPVSINALCRVIDRHQLDSNPEQQPVAADEATRKLLSVAERVAATNVTVTLSGPSGSGKEVFARHIHNCSPRHAKPFVAINCAAIPESMLEAVLFGHEKGAFTGANASHAGKFEQANGGTLLLDEVSEMDLALQAKLLRVLQEKEVERIGGSKTLAIDVRVLATTNRDLRQYVAEGRFREDLYYRLNVFPLHIPALRERRDDILPLAQMCLRQFGSDGIELTGAARDALVAHPWPGNVRELENLMQRSLILLSDKRLDEPDLVFEETESGSGGAQLSVDMRNHEYQLIIDALTTYRGKRAEVARALGISARSLRYKLARMRAEGIVLPGETS